LLQSLLFLLLWSLANTVPWLATGLLYYFLPIGGALAWLFACLSVGIAQWLVLQRYISGLGQWPIATFIGGLLGYTGFAASILAALIVPLGTGLSVGIAQWFVLRHKLTGAFWWIFATTLGAIVGLGLGYILPTDMIPTSIKVSYGSIEQTIYRVGIIIEIASSLITGGTMLWLLNRNANRKAVIDR
jgi:hypothetical protein